MFTGMLQNLLNSSGQSVAIQRMQQLNSYVRPNERAINIQSNPITDLKTTATISQNQDIPELNTFEDVLNSSLNVHTRFDINKPKYEIKFGELTTQAKKVNNFFENQPIDTSNIENLSLINPLTESQAVVSAVNTDKKSQLKDLINKISKKHGVDEKLVHAIIKQESGYNPNAKSSAGAQGLMQLMPATAKFLGVNDPYNPVQNIDGGVRYLKSMLDRYNGSIPLALAAYNAGPGNVDKYSDIPPFKETQNYVKSILANYL